MRALFIAMITLMLNACAATSHPAQLVEVGLSSRLEQIKPSLEKKGPIHFQKVVAAQWVADRSGLINLDDPKAKAAGIKAGEEAIQIYFYVLDHPQFGRYLIDTGIEATTRVNGMVAKFMNVDRLKIEHSTRAWVAQNPGLIKGVFLTHMHIDHILGVPDVPITAPIFIGPDESTHKRFAHMFSRGTADELFEGDHTLSEMSFPNEQPGVLDFFGDRSLFIISVPGHTAGSLAFVINSSDGPQLVVGDSAHTRWGWENTVAPGDYSEDIPGNQKSLELLKNLAASIPGVHVHPGHQSL